MKILFEMPRSGALLVLLTLVAALVAPGAQDRAGLIAQSGNRQRIQPDWMTFDKDAKRVNLEIVAASTQANSGWNFNGYADGDLTIGVPLDWTVQIHFRTRDGNYPHSVMIVEIEDPMPVNGDEATLAFPRAFSLNYTSGFLPPKEDTFDFKVNRTGRFWLFCGVPPHGRAGMWDYFVVSDEISEPYVEVVKQEGSQE